MHLQHSDGSLTRRSFTSAVLGVMGGMGAGSLAPPTGGRRGLGVGAPDEPPPDTGPDVFDVTKFGARGDGSQDDLLPFRRAVAAAADNGGGIVFVPVGRYHLSAEVDLRDRITLAGRGMPEMWLTSRGTTHGEFIGVRGADDVGVHGLTLRARHGVKAENAIGITGGSTHVQVSNCRIEGFSYGGSGGKGVTAQQGAEAVFVRHNLIRDCHVGGSFEGTSGGGEIQGAVFSHNRVVGCRGAGYATANEESPLQVAAVDAIVAHNSFRDCGTIVDGAVFTGDRGVSHKVVENWVDGPCTAAVRGKFIESEFRGNSYRIQADHLYDLKALPDGAGIMGARCVFRGERLLGSRIHGAVFAGGGYAQSHFDVSIDMNCLEEQLFEGQFEEASNHWTLSSLRDARQVRVRGDRLGASDVAAKMTRSSRGSRQWSPGSIASKDAVAIEVAVPGAEVGDLVATSFSSALPPGMILSGHVTSTDEVTVTLANLSGGRRHIEPGEVRVELSN